MGHARASHCIHPDLPRGGNAAAQLNRVKDKRSTSGINSAVAYAKANRNFSAMAAGRHATMLHLPSNGDAIAGRAEQKIVKTVARAKAHLRLPIIEVLVR